MSCSPNIPGLDGSGDVRSQIASFVLSNQSRIRAMVRRKLTPATRGVFDSEDVVASVLRRMDQLAVRGRLRVDSERELWGLVSAIAHNSAISKTRVIERWRCWAGEGAYAAGVLSRVNACADDDDVLILVYEMATALEEPRDRQLFFLRLRGANHQAAAGILGMTEQAVRKRWERVCIRLRERFGEEA